MKQAGVSVREYQVHPALAPFVKCIWSQESDQAIFDASRARILPDSCVELMFHFRDPFGTSDIKSSTGWHELRVTMTREHIECYYDGKKDLDVNDSTFKEAGKIPSLDKGRRTNVFR